MTEIATRKSVGLIGAVLVAAIIAATLSVTGSANAEGKGTRVLTLDALGTFNTSFTSLMDKGERKYSEADLFRQDEFETEDPIGKRRITEVASEPVGVPGGIGWGVYTTFDEGDIFTSEIFGIEEDGVFRTRGVINGGTGVFSDAAGTVEGAFDIRNSEDRVVARWTFVFEKPLPSYPKAGDK